MVNLDWTFVRHFGMRSTRLPAHQAILNLVDHWIPEDIMIYLI